MALDGHDYWKLSAILFAANHDSFHLLSKIEAEHNQYKYNLRRLYSAYKAKYLALAEEYGWEGASKRVGAEVVESAGYLREFLGGRESDREGEEYLTEIWHFWRRYGGKGESEEIEEVWRWVAGRPMGSLEHRRWA